MSKTRQFVRRHMPAIFIAAGVVIGLLVGVLISRYSTQRQIYRYLANYQMGGGNTKFGSGDKLSATLSYIDNMYVDSIKLDTIVENMMPKLLEQLDPHSAYIPAKDMQRVNESLDGEFDGIGVVFNMATDTVIVLNVITAGPSAKAGIMARDRIIKINDSLVAGRNIAQDSIVGQLKGKRGTTVKLGIERSGVEGLVDIEVTRGKIPIYSIGAVMMIEDSIGYINMSQFARTTYEEFMRGVDRLQSEGMQSLILDLRGNPGGYMDQAIEIATEFLPKGALIVYTEDRAGNQQREYSMRSGSLQNLELVVLVDESSASSSEIVAGALQDNDRGVIIGRRTFGKGLVQRQIPFSDGSAIRLTTARYYTPTGRSIQKPYVLGEGENYDLEILDRFNHDEFFTADSIAFDDSLRFVTPKGRVVYGGGGIMPDIFVPASKEKLPEYFVEVTGKNILYRYTIEYSDRNRDALAAVETLADLADMFAADESLVDDFVDYASRNGVKGTSSDIAKSRKYLEYQLKAFIGRNTSLEDSGYYINMYPLDDTLLRALEEVKQ